MRDLSWPKRILLVLATVLYVSAGILHFTRPQVYVKIMPPYLPWHLALVQVSGAFEILGGAGLLIPATRRIAAWGLVALLVAVFPANLYMATNPVETGATAFSAALRWGRLPLQAVLIAWVLWSSTPPPSTTKLGPPRRSIRPVSSN
jgi:uncharacterized membrane protein